MRPASPRATIHALRRPPPIAVLAATAVAVLALALLACGDSIRPRDDDADAATGLDCRDPDGADGAVRERTRFAAAVVPRGATCSGEMQTSQCARGSWQPWSGTFAHDTCAVAPGRACTAPAADDGAVDQRTRYQAAAVPFGQACLAEDQRRTCDDGAWQPWSGTFTEARCDVAPPRACTSPDAAHGDLDRRIRFASATVPYGQPCLSEAQTRSCDDGAWSAWSGTYRAGDCKAPTLVSLTIRPSHPVIEGGRSEAVQLTAFGTLDDGRQVDVTAMTRWRSANVGVVEIGVTTGTARGLVPGTTTLTATLDGHTATADASVRLWTKTAVAPLLGDSVDFAGDGDGALGVAWSDPLPSGHHVARVRTWRGTWGAVEDVVDSASFLRPITAISAHGDSALLWRESVGARSLLAITRPRNDAPWSSPVTLASGGPDADLAMGPTGTAIVVWREVASIMLVAFDAATGWALPATPIAGTSYWQIAGDDTGDGIVLTHDDWSDPTAGHALYAFHVHPGAAPARVTLYSRDVPPNQIETIDDFRLAADGHGQAIAIWAHTDVRGTELVSARHDDSGWQAPVSVMPLGHARVSLGNAAMSAGTVAIAFQSDFLDGEDRLYGLTFTAARGWSSPVRLGRPGYRTSLYLNDRPVGVAADGRALVAWKESLADDGWLVTRRFDPDLGWGPPRILGEAHLGSEARAFALRDGFVVGYVDGGKDVGGVPQPKTIRAAFFR